MLTIIEIIEHVNALSQVINLLIRNELDHASIILEEVIESIHDSMGDEEEEEEDES